MKVITNDNRIEDNFAMYLELTDKEIMFVQERGIKNVTTDEMLALMQSQGNNAHIVSLRLCDEVKMMKNVECLLKVYDTVSWYNREFKFHIRRSACHFLHQ